MRRLAIGLALSILAAGASIGYAQRISNQVNATDVTTVNLTATTLATLPKVLITPTSQTVADDGAGTAAAGTITYTTGVHVVTCSDANTCAMTLSETGASAGHILVVLNVSANAITFADSAGVQIVPSTTCSLAQHGTISFLYANSQWQVIAHTATCS